MDETLTPDPGMAPAPGPARRGLRSRGATAALVLGLMAGGMVGGYVVAGAATSPSPSSSSSGTSAGSSSASSSSTAAPGVRGDGRRAPDGGFDPTKGGHVGANGVVEKLLTGDTADTVRAAALAAVPGGTVERVENDAEGSPYEAHMVKPDGTHVTVKVDASFKVTNIETDGGMH